MRTSSFLKATFLGAALLGAAAGFAPEAKAMDEGQCMSAADFKAQRLAEKQQIVAVANQPVDLPVRKDLGVFFTMDRDGGIAYVVQSDVPYKEAAGKLCISNKIYNAHLNFDRAAPLSLMEGTDPVQAKKECDALISQGSTEQGTCKTLDAVIASGLNSGWRPLLWGKQTNGVKYVFHAHVDDSGQPIGDPLGAGVTNYSSAAGATVPARPLKETMLNPDAFKAILEQAQQPQVAQNAANTPTITLR